jgi:hypothetical protein
VVQRGVARRQGIAAVHGPKDGNSPDNDSGVGVKGRGTVWKVGSIHPDFCLLALYRAARHLLWLPMSHHSEYCFQRADTPS